MRSKIPYSLLIGIVQVLGEKVISDILAFMDFEAEEVPFIIHNLSRVQTATHRYYFDFELIKCLFMYSNYGILSRKEKNKIIQVIQNLVSAQ